MRFPYAIACLGLHRLAVETPTRAAKAPSHLVVRKPPRWPAYSQSCYDNLLQRPSLDQFHPYPFCNNPILTTLQLRCSADQPTQFDFGRHDGCVDGCSGHFEAEPARVDPSVNPWHLRQTPHEAAGLAHSALASSTHECREF